MGQVSSLWQRMRLLLILPLLAVAIAQKRSYDGHQVLRVGPLDDESYFVLRDLQMTSNALDFWTEPAPGRTTDINIPPEGLASVKAWLEEKGISYSIIPIGESYEGRKMNVLAITKAGPGAPNIWLESGIHAREWISPAVATFIVRELVEDYAEHPSYIDNINWYFLPSARC